MSIEKKEKNRLTFRVNNCTNATIILFSDGSFVCEGHSKETILNECIMPDILRSNEDINKKKERLHLLEEARHLIRLAMEEDALAVKQTPAEEKGPPGGPYR